MFSCGAWILIYRQLTVSILYDVVQRPRPLPYDHSDAQRNSLINNLTGQILGLLVALDDLSIDSHELAGVAREEGHAELLRVKTSLGFM